jgi:hypothetical protein
MNIFTIRYYPLSGIARTSPKYVYKYTHIPGSAPSLDEYFPQ